MDITDALLTAAHFHDLEKPQRNSDGDTMREAATEIHRLRAERDVLRLRNAELVELLRQIHEAANKVYQMGDATARNTLVNIYEISGKILTIATAK